MQDSFLGLSPIAWAGTAAIAALVAAVASVLSTVIVAFVARFTYQYMQSTKELVSVAKMQSDASIRQADASIKTLDLMRIERLETDSFQRALFIHSVDEIVSALGHYRNVLGATPKPWKERDCNLFPPEWTTCRSFVSRKAPHLLEEMQSIEEVLNEACNEIQGLIHAPDSQWLPTTQRRSMASLRFFSLQNRINTFKGNALKSE